MHALFTWSLTMLFRVTSNVMLNNSVQVHQLIVCVACLCCKDDAPRTGSTVSCDQGQIAAHIAEQRAQNAEQHAAKLEAQLAAAKQSLASYQSTLQHLTTELVKSQHSPSSQQLPVSLPHAFQHSAVSHLDTTAAKASNVAAMLANMAALGQITGEELQQIQLQQQLRGTISPLLQAKLQQSLDSSSASSSPVYQALSTTPPSSTGLPMSYPLDSSPIAVPQFTSLSHPLRAIHTRSPSTSIPLSGSSPAYSDSPQMNHPARNQVQLHTQQQRFDKPGTVVSAGLSHADVGTRRLPTMSAPHSSPYDMDVAWVRPGPAARSDQYVGGVSEADQSLELLTQGHLLQQTQHYSAAAGADSLQRYAGLLGAASTAVPSSGGHSTEDLLTSFTNFNLSGQPQHMQQSMLDWDRSAAVASTQAAANAAVHAQALAQAQAQQAAVEQLSLMSHLQNPYGLYNQHFLMAQQQQQQPRHWMLPQTPYTAASVFAGSRRSSSQGDTLSRSDTCKHGDKVAAPKRSRGEPPDWRRIFVGNIGWWVDEGMLTRVFGKYGTVTNVQVCNRLMLAHQ